MITIRPIISLQVGKLTKAAGDQEKQEPRTKLVLDGHNQKPEDVSVIKQTTYKSGCNSCDVYVPKIHLSAMLRS